MLRRRARRDRLIGLFALGVLLLDPPILNLVGGTLSGWPGLYLYLFAVWGLLIVGLALAGRRPGSGTDERDRDAARR